ncbi:MAG: RNA-binding S4 domain-containing protein [bacterium]|nr:RNA-binding S4 domain-containing protein [bacterium]
MAGQTDDRTANSLTEPGSSCDSQGESHILQSMEDESSGRLDIWLDVACLYKTRSQAQTACKKGKVEVNGSRCKPHRLVRPGDEIRISLPFGYTRIVVVKVIQLTHVSKAEARKLYDDRTPEPTAEEIAARRLQKLSAPAPRPRGSGAPKKGERRRLRRIKEEW